MFVDKISELGEDFAFDLMLPQHHQVLKGERRKNLYGLWTVTCNV